jgi:hypothetical protein
MAHFNAAFTTYGTHGEIADGLFQPDTLALEEYLQESRRTGPLDPERALMLAILEDGVACYKEYAFSNPGPKRALFSEAEAWICSDDYQWPFSFVNLCEVFGISPQYVRQGLLRWKSIKNNGVQGLCHRV